MLATGIFAIMATSLTGLFLQNVRYAKWQTNNVQVTNTSFGILDQIKNMGSDSIWKAYSDATNATTLTVTVADPSDVNDGYKDVALKINRKDGTNITSNPITQTTLKLGRLAKSPEIPVKYWVTLKRNQSALGVTPRYDVIELTLIYSWSSGVSKSTSTGQLQLVFPAPTGSFD